MKSTFARRLIFWVPLFILSIILNEKAVRFFASFAAESGTVFFAYLCSFIFFIIFIAVATETIFFHQKKRFIVPFLMGLFLSLWIGITFKRLFAIDRPYIEYGLSVLVPETDFSFPSNHTLTAFTLLPLMAYKNKKTAFVWFLFACLIGFARMYLQVHYLSDVIFGAFIGYETTSFFISLEEKYNVFSKFNHLLLSEKEIRRQLFHTAFGILLIFLYKMFLLTTETLLFFIVISIIFILLLKRFKIPFLHTVLSFFEREKHLKQFPARGILCFMIGSWLAFYFFPPAIAVASILILALGDSITNIIGRYFGKRPIFFNPDKKWEGTLSGILFGTIGASFFVPLWIAFLASSGAMLLESFPFRVGKYEIDDNILIPVVAGGVMMLLI